jgi:hypothetical protein
LVSRLRGFIFRVVLPPCNNASTDMRKVTKPPLMTAENNTANTTHINANNIAGRISAVNSITRRPSSKKKPGGGNSVANRNHVDSARVNGKASP